MAVIERKDDGYIVNGQYIGTYAARELANFIDNEYDRSDMIQAIDDKYDSEGFAESLPKGLLDKLVEAYRSYREDDKSWICDAKTAISEFSESIEKEFCSYNKQHSKSIVSTRFDCEEDLSKYVDSLLFADDEVPAVAEYKDGEGNTVNLRLIVTGDVHLVYKEVDYRSPSDYTQELIDLIKSGKAEENGVYIGLNNWFELVYSVCDTTGKEIAYDGEVFESDLSKMTPSELKTNLTDYAKYLFGSYEKELKKSNSAKEKTQRRETTDIEL